MGIVKKQGISITLISFVGVVVGALNTMFIFPRVLGAEKHGLIMLILSIATVVAQFSHLGVPNTIIRFSPLLKERKIFIYRLALQVPLMALLLLSILFFAFGEFFFASYINENALFVEFRPIILPLTTSLFFFEVLLSVSRSELKTVFPAVLREFILRIVTLLLLGLFAFNIIDFTVFVYSWLGMYCFNVFLLGMYLLRFTPFKFEFGFPLFPDSSLGSKMLKYGVVTLLTSSAAILVNRIDVLMLGYYLELENIAFYSVAFFMASLIQIPARSILQIVKPLLAKAWADDDITEIVTLYRKTALNQMIIGFVLFLCIWLNIEDILQFVPEKYQGIQMVFFYVGISKLIDVSVGVNGAIISTSSHYKYDLYINIFLIILTIISNVIFIPVFGIVGAAMATALAILLHNFTKTIVLYSLYRIQPFQLNTLKFLIVCFLGYSIIQFIPFNNIDLLLLRVVLKSICISSFIIILSLWLRLSDDLNQLLNKFVPR